jgi:hypothetical protein
MAMATLEKNWIVDYDLPKFPAARRVQFYRIKNRLIKDAMTQNCEIRILLSSMSVLLTNSQGLARNISALAQYFAASSTHVYELDGLQEV